MWLVTLLVLALIAKINSNEWQIRAYSLLTQLKCICKTFGWRHSTHTHHCEHEHANPTRMLRTRGVKAYRAGLVHAYILDQRRVQQVGSNLDLEVKS
jgi:hypothetical protein